MRSPLYFSWHLLISLYRFGLAIRDLSLLHLPFNGRANGARRFGFLIHDRDGTDVYRWFPILEYLPRAWQDRIRWWLWPFRAKRITTTLIGPDGKKVQGWLLAVILTAEQMVSDRHSLREAQAKIDDLFLLADKLGISIVGLGAYSASVTRLGRSIKGRDNGIACPTTGHSFTAAAVVRNVMNMVELLEMDRSTIRVAIVGAGSIGSTCARLLVNKGIRNMTIVDVSHSVGCKLATEMEARGVSVVVGTDMMLVRDSDVVVTATTSPHAILRPEHLKPGMVVVDDAQPRNISREVAVASQVMVVDGGVVHNDRVNTNFDFGFYSLHDVLGCLGESIVLATTSDNGLECTIGEPDPSVAERLDEVADQLGFERVLRSFDEPITAEQVYNFRSLVKARMGQV